MHRSLLIFFFAAAPLQGQAYTGGILGRFAKDSNPAQDISWSVKGPRTQVALTVDSKDEIAYRFLYHQDQQIYREGSFIRGTPAPQSAVDEPPAPVAQLSPLVLTPTGKKPGKVAGIVCTESSFEVGGRQLTGCFSTEIGSFVAPSVRGRMELSAGKGRTWSPGFPEWALAINGMKEFPLKVWDAKGKNLFEVSEVRPNVLPRCFFEIPANIQNQVITARTTVVTQGNNPAALDAALRQALASMPPPPPCQGPWN